MRHGLTAHDLLIIITVLIIGAAVGGPFLLEWHMSARQVAAIRTLKSGILPAMTEFQSKACSDVDHDGRGEYARDHRFLAGATAGASIVGGSVTPLTFLPRAFDSPDGTVIGRYRFQIDTDIGAAASEISNAESYFGAYAVPATRFDGQRAFAMTVPGVIHASREHYAANRTNLKLVAGGVAGDNTGTFTNVGALLLSDPRTDNPSSTLNAALIHR